MDEKQKPLGYLRRYSPVYRGITNYITEEEIQRILKHGTMAKCTHEDIPYYTKEQLSLAKTLQKELKAEAGTDREPEIQAEIAELEAHLKSINPDHKKDK